MHQFNSVFVSISHLLNAKKKQKHPLNSQRKIIKRQQKSSRDWLLKYAGIITFAIFCRYENNPYL